jgi:hypothetical protein
MTIKERIEAAQNKAERFAQWADAAADEAAGAELIGLPERAERCRNSSAQHEEDAAVWSATARTLREQLPPEQLPPPLAPLRERRQRDQAREYNHRSEPYRHGYRNRIEREAYALDAERCEALGLAN